MPFEIPHGFAELLTDFTVSVVRKRPPDLVEYAIQYFTKLRIEDKKTSKTGLEPARTTETKTENEGGAVKFGFDGGGGGVKFGFGGGGGSGQERASTTESGAERASTKESENGGGGIKFGFGSGGGGVKFGLGGGGGSGPEQASTTESETENGGGGVKFGFAGGMKWNVGNAVPTEDDDVDNDSSSSLITEPTFLPTALHRKSVAAERYNPESDEDDDDVIPTYPKSDTQRKLLRDKMKDVLVFKSVDDDQKESLLNAMFEKKVVVGDVIIRQGDDGDNFYVIESGTYDIFVQKDGEDKKVAECNNEGSFGELALMYNTPRAATVIAASEGIIWGLDRTTFKNIVVRQAFKKRQLYENLLEEVPLLKELTTYERMNVADALKARSFKDGEYIIRQGDPGVDMYFVEEGTIVITKSDGGVESEMTRLGKGAYFGELALVTNQPRAASARSLGETKLACLDVLSFERLLGPCMDVMKRNADAYE